MSTLSTSVGRSDSNSSSTIDQTNKKAPKKQPGRRKCNNRVRFTDPLVSDTKIIYYPKLSLYEKQKLFYNRNDIQRFQYEYYAENGRSSIDPMKLMIYVISIIIAHARIITFLLQSKVLEPMLLSLKGASATVLRKSQTTLLEDQSLMHHRNVGVVFVESEHLLCDSA